MTKNEKKYFRNMVGAGSSKCIPELEKRINCYAFHRSFYGSG